MTEFQLVSRPSDSDVLGAFAILTARIAADQVAPTSQHQNPRDRFPDEMLVAGLGSRNASSQENNTADLGYRAWLALVCRFLRELFVPSNGTGPPLA